MPAPFSSRVLAWFDRHGRKDLPWQIDATPYRVWLSEVMLQQTQVQTVIPYFQRFAARFPEVAPLAAAPLDEVLYHWSGLGYYARARNLHRAAGIICETHAGELPAAREALQALPGIGRSTAAAILALAHGQRQAILDGNVKRVLARYHAIEGWPGTPAIEKHLWELTESHLPDDRVAPYTQAVMDIGATVCTRSRPRCAECPLRADCAALRGQAVHRYPAPRPRRTLPVRQTRFLIARTSAHEVLLERRPPVGIWGGLWALPEIEAAQPAEKWCADTLGARAVQVRSGTTFRHTFTHFHLDIEPVLCDIDVQQPVLMDSADRLWYKVHDPAPVGLAAPVKRILAELVRS